eukprot:TRINITY_DN10017_c0_g1_i2.p1 TRINITY_DN10017_c0_g1~~TRINITY_DN10017_c0_g1_i2.p1  ORF type:complete len:220 (+),score=57.64 TRINITY_DN10017_c0_g1_i2:57-716(+)
MMKGLAGYMTESELEFVAEFCEIAVMPSISLPQLDFAFGSYGPFRAQVPAFVPLWLALELKKCKRCRIQPPEWLDKDYLENVITQEKAQTFLCSVPEHFIELAYLLFKHAPEDINDIYQLRSLITTLENIREAKLRSSLGSINAKTTHCSVNDVTWMEIKKIQPYVLQAMDNLHAISQLTVPAKRPATMNQDEGMLGAGPSSSFQETQTGTRNLRPFRN